MNETLTASSPDQNAVVMASAGTGKTWLLVTRLLRLLMAGVPPDTILAITFTRKAAAEMQVRLLNRLYELLTLDDELLASTLERLAIPGTDESMLHARSLYENLLRNDRQIRITTFHAFCNEILQRFPIEADVPPGFDLLENGGLLEQEAYDALFNEATSTPDGELARALDTLLTQNSSTYALRMALDEFMQHRSDWWAYTHAEKHPVRYACNKLIAQLHIDPDQNPYLKFFNDNFINALREFAALLENHATQMNRKYIAAISIALDPSHNFEQRIGYVKKAFLTKEGKPLARKKTKTQEKALGHAGELRFLDIHQTICTQLGELQELERRLFTFNTSRAWYTAGEKLLGHYRRIKLERRQLDFTDLELKVYDLLNHSNNALWVQYKLDQRIDHLLIDEFQDTNPTQWRMILPLLHELAAGHHGHKRSVFLVGDSKQSIYRFRRANPQLIHAAHTWLEKHLNIKQYPLDVSWRSSQAIISFLNKVFSKGPLRDRLPSFQIHDTHLHDLWGKVELLPLIRTGESDSNSTMNELRNPLDTPRITIEDLRHYQEGRLIACRIKELLENNTLINTARTARPLTYNDIIILVRNRTHMPAYEKALREAHIPYQSASRTTLLDSLEAQDIVALLETLITPYNNLSLATVLRSPLFDCSDNDLMLVAAHTHGNTASNKNIPWIERLNDMAPSLANGSALKRAGHWLTRWRSLAGQLPVHDLLDRIFSEGNVLQRYQAAFPAHLQQRVIANLSRFIELALEIDSGRYPSLSLFLSTLRSLRQYSREALDEPAAITADSVRIMTIHAAKGLEAAAVFIADTAKNNSRARIYRAMINWPADSEKPSHYFITGKKSDMDQRSRVLFDRFEQEELREEANLLYVALSRAKQLLYISGCAPNRGDALGWYGMMVENLADNTEQIINNGYILETGYPLPRESYKTCTETQQVITPDPGLSQPIPQSLPGDIHNITPSDTVEDTRFFNNKDDGILRGNIIHRILALLTAKKTVPEQALLQQVAGEFSLSVECPALEEYWQEASRLIHHPALQEFFDPARFIAAYNEIPVQYFISRRFIHGIIDRLVLNQNNIIVIDYKTQQYADRKNLAKLAKPYFEQIRLYSNGVQKIWPEKTVRCILLFTACAEAYELGGDKLCQAEDLHS